MCSVEVRVIILLYGWRVADFLRVVNNGLGEQFNYYYMQNVNL